MKKLLTEFERNIGQTGLQTFKQLKAGVSPNDKPVYIYSRTYVGGQFKGNIFSYETVICNVKPAGDVTFPNGVVVHHDEPFEEYTPTSQFGNTGWEFRTLEHAEKKFNEIVNGADKLVLKYPEGEFTMKEIAELNNVTYALAHKFTLIDITENKVEHVRKEARGKGKPTNIYKTT